MTNSSTARPVGWEPDSHVDQPPVARDPLGETHDQAADTDAQLAAAAARAAATAETWIGRKIGRYEIQVLLGTGGMGVVYKAHDTLIERDVAIKILPPEIARDELNLKRFLAEARAAGKLTHPNAVAIYEAGQEGDVYYLVMEYVAGGSVSDQLEREGPLGVREATRIVADACGGLVAAHAVNLVHRDIKPANLLHAADGSVKVADFGLAKPTIGGNGQLTQTGLIIGTPYFMSPEQCEARAVDHRSDVYSLGATYYSLLTGAQPYDSAGSLVQVMFAHVHGEILDPRKTNPAVPPACCQIIARSMAKDPNDRYEDASEMLADLESLLATLSAGGPTAKVKLAATRRTRRRRMIVATCLAAVLAVLGLSYHLYRDATAANDRDGAAHAALPAVPTGRPIRVGVLHSLSGTMAESESVVVEATLLAIEELNQSGGLLGRPIEAVVRDGRSEPEVFAAEAKKLINEERVCTVFGCWTSACRKTVLPTFERHNHLLVYPVQYEGLEQSPNVVYLGATPNQQIVPALCWASAFGGKRTFFLVGSDYIFPRAAGAIIHDVLGDLGGAIVGEEYLPLGSYDVKSVVAKIAAAKPDVILNTINGDSNVPFFKELRAAGITPERIPTISFSIGEEELRHLNVSQIEGDYAAWSYFESVDLPENREFVSRFKAKYGPQRVLTDPMEAAYVGVKLWGQAVEQAHSDDVTKIRRALVHQRMVGPEGAVRIESTTHHVCQTPRIGRVKADGQFEVIWKAVNPEPPVPFPPSRTPREWKAFLDEWYTRWGNQWSAPVQ